jgi:uncharacterized membrane protein YdjX (TVP38/TMEM64 family)
MEKGAEQTEKFSGRTLLKSIIFIVFVVLAVCILRITPAKSFLTPQAFDLFLEALGFWGPFVFILIFAAGICLLVPTSILALLGAALFGSSRGFIYAWIGALAGSCVAFFIGRTMGRDFVVSLMGDRLKKFDDAIERNGFATVLYLRLLNTPFTYMNFGIGLTKINFLDYLLGTGLGIIVSIFVLTFLGGTLREVWASGNWEQLISIRVLIALVLFFFSFFIPLIIKKLKGDPPSRST